MRELICKVIRRARRAAWMEPAVAKDSDHGGTCASDVRGAPSRFDGFEPDVSLGAQAVRKARVAAAIHMDQASKLRANAATARAARTSPTHQVTERSI